MENLIFFFTYYPEYLTASVLLLSVMVGSFLNVLILRYPIILFREWLKDSDSLRDELPKHSALQDLSKPYSISFPRSHCPVCRATLKPWHNIPILSYIFLKGSCHQCGGRISPRYPFVELLTGVLSVMPLVKFSFSFELIGLLFLTWALIALSAIDIDHLLIPDSIVYVILWSGLALNAYEGFVKLDVAVMGAIAGYLSLWSIYWVVKIFTGVESMGYGDFKLLAALGAWFGIGSLLPIIYIASVSMIAFVFFHFLRTKTLGRVPFGPFLSAAGWCTGVFSLTFSDVMFFI